MKVAHVGFSPNVGGASVAMKRIHEAAYSVGVASSMIFFKGDIKEHGFNSYLRRKDHLILHELFLKVISVLIRVLQRTKYKTTRSINIFPTGFANYLNNTDYDVIHFHWIGNETLSIKEFADIKKPIVWTMHDLWGILGAEHNNISFSSRYCTGYNKKNRPPGYSAIDIERFVWNRKFKRWKDKQINIVAVSNWQKNLISDSPIFANSKVTTINNPINTKQWVGIDKDVARGQLNISTKKKLLLFGAFGASVDPIKGFKYLIEALNALDLSEIEVAIFGANEQLELQNVKLYQFGAIKEQSKLIALYSAADVMVVPSLQETFGQTASEAMACGTPVVAFEGSGLDDIVTHMVTGYLALPYVSEDLAQGILWALSQSGGIETRDSIIERFNYSLIGSKYKSLYQQVINS